MDKLVIERKLDSLYRCLNRVSEKCPANVADLLADLDLQDVIVLNLSRAVQMCVDLGAHMLSSLDQPPPNTMGETFDRMADAKVLDRQLADRMKKSVGFRNIAVYNYDDLDWAIVHAIASRHVADFRAFAAVIVRSLDED